MWSFDWDDKLDALMEDEKWEQWEESKIAHDWIADEEPLTDSE